MPHVTCPYCGKIHWRKPSNAANIYCNRKCWNDFCINRHIGKRYGRYIILEYDATQKKYKAQCDCGAIKKVGLPSLKSGDTVSCGCHRNDVKTMRNIGKRYGRYIILEYDATQQKYKAQCDCGTIKKVRLTSLKNGSVVSCGCYHREITKKACTARGFGKRKIISPGTRFGRLVVIEDAGVKKHQSYSLCQCDCGNQSIVRNACLKSRSTHSCGCYKLDLTRERNKLQFTKHGLCKYPSYLKYLKRSRYQRDKSWTLEMDQALRQFQTTCVVCNSDNQLAIDHVVPFIAGGDLEPGNVCILCKSCNSSKRDRALEELPPKWAVRISRAAQEFLFFWENQ